MKSTVMNPSQSGAASAERLANSIIVLPPGYSTAAAERAGAVITPAASDPGRQRAMETTPAPANAPVADAAPAASVRARASRPSPFAGVLATLAKLAVLACVAVIPVLDPLHLGPLRAIKIASWIVLGSGFLMLCLRAVQACKDRSGPDRMRGA